MKPARVVAALDEAEDLSPASEAVRNERRQISSHSSVAKKLSHMALSHASPAEPMDCAMPDSRQRSPKAREVYCEPLSE